MDAIPAVKYSGKFTPPGAEILKKWKELPPMTYDLANKIMTLKEKKPLEHTEISGNSQWVEDVYMKIGDSMFMYTG